ncbi:MAG TPA: AAA family ATPase, partial [Pseudomonas sp.]|nr:AAA family ATPase [Pseudomonas sp.]
MDVELKAFLQRAEGLLARIEPLLPAQPAVIDWDRTFAARWQR